MTCACKTPSAPTDDAGCSGGESFALRVLGEDMRPEFNEGDIIIDDQVRQFRGIRDSENAGVAIIFQELSLVKELTVGENIFLGHAPRTRIGLIDWATINRDLSATR